MKKHKKKQLLKGVGLFLSIIFFCFLIYFSGYRHGYKTAGYKYYYDGMKVKYAFMKIHNNCKQMQKEMEHIPQK